MATTTYALGLGSNRMSRVGPPRQTVLAGLKALQLKVVACSRVIETPPLGPGGRRYANIAALVETSLDPLALLARAKEVERRFGRRRGQRWGDRVLDIDLLLWSEGGWRQRTLTVPHAALARRLFALGPLDEIAPDWRLGRSRVRHAYTRLTRPRPLHRG